MYDVEERTAVLGMRLACETRRGIGVSLYIGEPTSRFPER